MPVLKDDEGNPVTGTVIGPPPLFPDTPQGLPERPAQDERKQAATKRRKLIRKAYLSLPYMLNSNKQGGAGNAAQIDKWSADAPPPGTKPAATGRPPGGHLLDWITLAPRMFPDELYSRKARNMAAHSASQSKQQRAYWETQSKHAQDVDLLERMAREEAAGAAAGGARGGAEGGADRGEAGAGARGEEDEEEVAVEEEEDDDFEGDDYYQGEHFDDDEGYDDGYDDGGDEAVF